MPLAFADRPPTPAEVQRFRLILSTYQDGTGQYAVENDRTLPGWRDFERSVAFAFGGESQESKAIFDVLLSDMHRGVKYGISCKMRATLSATRKIGRVTIELSNSAGEFWGRLGEHGIDQQDYANVPAETGRVIIEVVEGWHNAVSLAAGGDVDLAKSSYLTLQYDKKVGEYQLYQFPLELPNPRDLEWQVKGRRLVGYEGHGSLFEWYGHSGAQLKYYPLVENAAWVSECFRLEPLPERAEGYGVLGKAAVYFPDLWREANNVP